MLLMNKDLLKTILKYKNLNKKSNYKKLVENLTKL